MTGPQLPASNPPASQMLSTVSQCDKQARRAGVRACAPGVPGSRSVAISAPRRRP
jgi:hypothetical protein